MEYKYIIKIIKGAVICISIISLNRVFAETKNPVSNTTGEKPGWISKPPLPDNNYVYFVGIKTNEKTIEEGREAAAQDVLEQVVKYMGMKVSLKLISRKSRLIDQLAEETKLYASANVQGTIIKEMYCEQDKKNKLFSVYILARYSKIEIEKEKERIHLALNDYEEKIDILCDEVLLRLQKNNIRQILVGEFTELISQGRYFFSNILENDIKVRIAAENIAVAGSLQDSCVLSGTYRVQGEDIVVSVYITDNKIKENVFASHISINKDVLEPDWLKTEKPQERYFLDLNSEPPEKKKYGALSVTSVPFGAKIYINGEHYGRTDVDMHHIPVGIHNISIINDKYKVYNQAVRISEGSVTRTDVKLEAQKGGLKIKTNTKKADVYINNEFHGLSPCKIENLFVGVYEIAVKKKGYKSSSKEVEVFPGDVEEITIDISEEDGSLLVTSSPLDARVYIDSEFVGLAAPLFIERVSAGIHDIRIEKEGYESFEKNVTVKSFAAYTVSADLKKMKTGIIKVYSVPSSALVYLDKAEAGATPLVIEGVSAGIHGLEIIIDEDLGWTGTVEVNSGEAITLLKQLKQQAEWAGMD
ncbi:MAG: PEGA domain-containing protein [Elusimicrobiota bacterium]